MGNQSDHALFSPSSGHKWIRCTGALAMEVGFPNTTNKSAEQGTAAHELASWALTDGRYSCAAYVGRVTANEWEVTEEMAEATQVYVDAIRARVEEYRTAGAVSVHLYVENRVDLSDVVGIPDQFGTSDSIFLVEWADGTWLIGVEDFKFGYRIVTAEENEQLMLYVLAALYQYGIVGNFTRARMVIHQPNREHVSDWECDVDTLLEFGAVARAKAQAASKLMGKPKGSLLPFLTPGDKQCQYCKAAGTCPALGKWASDLVSNEFANLTEANILTPLEKNLPALGEEKQAETLGLYLRAMPLLEIFCKGVLTAAEVFMFAGGKIAGFKVVAGKKGRRSWGSNAAEAEAAMKAMRLKQEEMYSFKLISPTQAEKVLKKESPRRWKKLQDLVVQSEGQPSIAEDADNREPLAITKPEDDFGVLDNGGDLA